MADETIKPNFNLGIENSSILGDFQTAEAFLSGSEEPIQKIDPEEEEKKKAIAEAKKQEDEKKKAEESQQKKIKKEETPKGEDLLNNILTEDEEEEGDDEEDKSSSSKPVKKSDESSATNTFEDLSTELYEAGVFTVDEDEEPVIAKTPEEFLELFNKEKTKGASIALENFLSKHGDDRRELFDAIFVNGVDPKEYLPVYNQVEDFENIDLNTEENQETVVREFYTRSGLSKEKVNAKIEKLKNYSELEEEAQNVHPLLVEQNKEKLQKMSEEAATKQRDLEQQDLLYRQSLTKVLQEKLKTKDFDGIPLDDKKVSKVFDFLYTKKWKLSSGELITDFDRFIMESKNSDNLSNRVKIALLAVDGFDFSKLQKKAVAKETKTLFNKLVKKDNKSQKDNEDSNSSWNF